MVKIRSQLRQIKRRQAMQFPNSIYGQQNNAIKKRRQFSTDKYSCYV